MAQEIVIEWAGVSSRFALAKIDREKLYGRKVRVAVDETGAECSTAWLTRDGTALVPTGGAAYLYLDERFEAVERSALVCVDEQGQPLPLIPSTLGVAQKAERVPPGRVLDHTATSVYALTAAELHPELAAALGRGEIFEFRFNWRSDYADAPAFLLQGPDGIFALVGAPSGLEMVQKAAAPAPAEPVAVDETDGDLDFGML